MARNRTIVNKNTIHKTYKAELLLDSSESISNRVNKINSLEYNNFTSLMKTNIVKKENIYEYTQDYTSPEKLISVNKNQLDNLTLSLEYLSSVSLVHGDLNRKNIIYTKTGFKIIDLEPSLNQIIDGTPRFMITKPYIAKSDLKQRRISTRTDKIGFFYFILRITNKIKTPDIVKLSKDLNHKTIMKFDESELDNLTYKNVLNVAWNCNVG